MNANEITFGIEIETAAPASLTRTDNLQIGAYRHGIQVPYLPAGWKAERDGSIEITPDQMKCEIVSPVLKGAAGLAEAIAAVRTLEAKGHKVNKSCGVHIHIGWDRNLPASDLARLITIVAYAEKGLYAITGTKSRERGIYCGGVRRYGDAAAAKQVLDGVRYHALNLTNLATGRQNTVEFRVFSGSTSATKIAGWVQVCLGLVERALSGKRLPKWSPEPLKGGWAKKAGIGSSEAERLMGYLAWGNGYAAHAGQQYGWISDEIPQAEIKAEFRRLAAKYDAQA